MLVGMLVARSSDVNAKPTPNDLHFRVSVGGVDAVPMAVVGRSQRIADAIRAQRRCRSRRSATHSLTATHSFTTLAMFTHSTTYSVKPSRIATARKRPEKKDTASVVWGMLSIKKNQEATEGVI